MSNVRSTIELLLKILQQNGALKIKAEIFRLAKFNQCEAVETLWHLLFELLYFCNYGSIEDVSVRAWMEMRKEEIVVYVKREMQRRGFLSPDLVALPNDMSAGSRDLLLALGWLLCKENVMQKFMVNCTTPLEGDDTEALYKDEKIDFSAPKFSQNSVERVKQLLWYNNKLQMNLRSLHAIQLEKNLLKHKIHQATYGDKQQHGDRNHLTMFEVHLLRHPELLQKNIDLLENDNERLQNLIRWRDCEDIFWKWMESVLDEKQKEKHVSADSDLESESLDVTSVTQGTMLRLQTSHDDLQEAIVKYENIVENLEHLWETKSGDVSEEELDRVISALDLELSIQKANIQLTSGERYLSTTDHHQFVYDERSDARKAASVSTESYTNGVTPLRETIVDIQNEISGLQSDVSTLQEKLKNKQNAFKHELEDLSASFADTLCIPPLSTAAVNV